MPLVLLAEHILPAVNGAPAPCAIEWHRFGIRRRLVGGSASPPGGMWGQRRHPSEDRQHKCHVPIFISSG